MTAAEYQSLAAETAQATAHVEAVTEQVRLRARSWEPAARHYRDLVDDEAPAHPTRTGTL
jgi:hypothetical protein